MSARLTRRMSAAALLTAGLVALAAPARAADAPSGVVKVKSIYPVAETIARLKKDVAGKGITFFMEIDQAKLAAGAGITLRSSTLLIFGNPPLGTQFITSKPEAGLDWPVRLLVFQDQADNVWLAYTDFGWIARRHGISDRDAQFEMASTVIKSIADSVAR
ncbi:MAG TPA: DUF302 domain-containing protein [Vineibacter sp.]|nr:DUF302 domain-containing protein [Vineibacter sp.]